MHVSHKDWLLVLMPICKLAERPLTNWDASSTRAHKCQQKIASNRKPAQFCKSYHFVRRKKKKRKRFEVVNSILLTNGYLHPIIPSASRDVLFNDLMQSSLSFKFDFQSLHFKWGKEKMVCQSWESLEMLIFFILILCIRDGKSKQSIIMCIMSLDTN